MVITMVTRFAHMRCVKNVNNFSSIGNAISVIQCSSILSKPYSTANNEIVMNSDIKSRKKPMNKTMEVYFQQAKEYKEFIQKQIVEYDIGKRHLANMMGEDPNNFSEADMNRSIRYLFPSGLYEPEARPMIIHPTKLYTGRKEAKFDETGRPHHFLFYTTRPHYYGALHRIAEEFNNLNKLEDTYIQQKILRNMESRFDISTTNWLDKTDLEEKLFEKLSDAEYEYFIASIERVLEHPLSNVASALLTDFRKQFKQISNTIQLPKMQFDKDKRPYILLKDCVRKCARGDIKVTGNGTGNITINGEDISYFKDIQCREQVGF